MMRCSLKDIERVMRVLDQHYKDDPIDVRKAFSFSLWRPDRYVLMPSENTVFLLEPHGERAWSVHVATTRHNPRISSDTIAAAKWMFKNVSNCDEIIGIPPGGRRDVSLYACRFCRALRGEWKDNVCRIRRLSWHLL